MKLSLLLLCVSAISALLTSILIAVLVPVAVTPIRAISALWQELTWSPLVAVIQLLAGAVVAGAITAFPRLRAGRVRSFFKWTLWAIALLGVLAVAGRAWRAWRDVHLEYGDNPLDGSQYLSFVLNALSEAPLRLISTTIVCALIWVVYDRRPSGLSSFHAVNGKPRAASP